ncbi:DNA-directed RNA polymerase subunit alpha C-terminal domain-containing protein [Nocardia asteroides]|uniref:DNA-directed RNA polymerase subunit alpha C-terminal domain-containing protein n=1 Tax=Nocardia asteroides TaxID=1824 RepID=UPI001E2B85DA|nr:DNA-directed RNA polymerase subunit alpha C-terminal domain-containing protein [Nocardia asteroides]UGT58752.1 hypothetical protein LTT85_31140 [Nocardia asteroides]
MRLMPSLPGSSPTDQRALKSGSAEYSNTVGSATITVKAMSESSAPMNLATTWLDMMLSGRVANMLARAGIATLADLLHYTRRDLESLASFGPLTIAEIETALAERDLHLARPASDLEPTLAEEFDVVLDQRDQLVGLIERIGAAVDLAAARREIATTMAGIDLTPTTRQAAIARRRREREAETDRSGRITLVE